MSNGTEPKHSSTAQLKKTNATKAQWLWNHGATSAMQLIMVLVEDGITLLMRSSSGKCEIQS